MVSNDKKNRLLKTFYLCGIVNNPKFETYLEFCWFEFENLRCWHHKISCQKICGDLRVSNDTTKDIVSVWNR